MKRNPSMKSHLTRDENHEEIFEIGNPKKMNPNSVLGKNIASFIYVKTKCQTFFLGNEGLG